MYLNSQIDAVERDFKETLKQCQEVRPEDYKKQKSFCKNGGKAVKNACTPDVGGICVKDQPENQFSRTELLIGEDGVKRLQKAKVALFGIGGVGGYVAEALVRSGVGAFDLIDNDTVSLTNLNRQIIADYHTLGRYKTEVMRERMLSINPKVQVTLHQCFYLPETAGQFDFLPTTMWWMRWIR